MCNLISGLLSLDELKKKLQISRGRNKQEISGSVLRKSMW